MKFENRMKHWLVLLLCILMAAGILAQGAMAAYPTGKCTNAVNEGIEFLSEASIKGEDANEWRYDLTVDVIKDGTTLTASEVIAMEVTVAGSNTRYQCTEVTSVFSCNSMPANSIINRVYLMLRPDSGEISEGDTVTFKVYRTSDPDKVLLNTKGKVKFPPYPCARNITTKDFVASDGEAAIINTSEDCKGEHNLFNFDEQDPQFTMVNIISGDTLVGDRFNIKIDPQPQFAYTLVLSFEGPDDGTGSHPLYEVTITHTENSPTCTVDASDLDGLAEADLPLTLIGGRMTDFDTSLTDLSGNKDFPTSFDFDIRFWYENTEGTLGYENSIFHFERNITVQFAPYCTDVTSSVLTAVASGLYDPCQAKKQLFSVDLHDENGEGLVIPDNQTDCNGLEYCNDLYSVYVTDAALSPIPKKNTDYRFVTRQCTDASCAYYKTTNAYLYSLTVADGDSLARTYKHKSNSSGSTTVFAMKAYENSAKNHPFAITGTRIMVEEPGTYVIYGFLESSDIKNNDLSKYAVKFYVTVNKKDELKTCSTLANNGYFRSYWNDCLSHAETQEMPFEHISGTQEAWIENRSNHGVHFPYNPEYSILPQKLEVVSLTCRASSLGGGNPKDAYCRPNDVYVPAHTKVTITGGRIRLEAKPTSDEYWVAYMREETMNISHLIFDVTVRSCDNVKKIPDTGISLRSPLKVAPKVDEATSYVFTGNSLRIPAIGLGMETPIPIVHVYYEEGSADRGWDLSTLGNYVGELEGGSYLPYAGNSALTGHYYSMGVFKNLEYLNIGDEIIVFGNDGIKYIYHVVEKFLTDPTDVYQMFQQVGERSLTLVTCENYNLVTDEYERRQLIRAVIDSQEPYEVNW